MSSTDFAVQKDAIVGRFDREYTHDFDWSPQYIKEFPKALPPVPLPLVWRHCKFVPSAKHMVPDQHGVYCFSVDLGQPFPEKIHLPLYIGKAAPAYLSQRFANYFGERGKVNGRPRVVVMLNMYRDRLLFWWAELPRSYVDVVEEHLLMCCKPPCNVKPHDRQKLWGKAF